jgi:hypothetical protein
MSKKRPPRTDEDLREAAKDVAFEFKMFRHAVKRLDSRSYSLADNSYGGASAPTTRLGHNSTAADLPLVLASGRKSTEVVPGASIWQSTHDEAMVQLIDSGSFFDIEGILIHFRNLIEFFFTNKRDKDNLVLAHHYTGTQPKNAPPWAKEYGQRCNELLAHLTYRRTHYRRDDKHHWPDIVGKCQNMDDEITRFLNSLAPDRRAWFY